MEPRIKTDVRISEIVLKAIGDAADSMGLTKNAFFIVSAALFAAQVAKKYIPGKKKTRILKELRKEIQKILNDAENDV